MSNFDRLTALGVRLSLAPGGQVQVQGLKALPVEAADEARDLIRQHKPALVAELHRRRVHELSAQASELLNQAVRGQVWRTGEAVDWPLLIGTMRTIPRAPEIIAGIFARLGLSNPDTGRPWTAAEVEAFAAGEEA